MEQPLMYQTMQYLASSLLQHVETGEEIVVVTIRPDKTRHRPHDIGLSRNQAEQLLQNLHRLLSVVPFLLFIASTGCSTRVDVTSEKGAPSAPVTFEKSSTSVAVDVLPAREKAPPVSSPPQERSASPGSSEKIVEIDGDGNVVVVVDGDLNVNVHDCPTAAGTRSRSGMHTKIGFPAQYREAGGWAFGCYLAVWGLVLAAIVLMLGNLNREEGGPLLSIVAMLGIAVILLQFLPHTESGLQLVPISPWSYIGWISFWISLVCWGMIVIAGYLAIDRSCDSPQVFSVVCLIAMLLNVLLSFAAIKEDLAGVAALRSQPPVSQRMGDSFSRADSYHQGRLAC